MASPEFPEEDANVPVAVNANEVSCGSICEQGAATARVNPGPIKLLCGRQGRGGFGLAHIHEQDRPKAIKGRGFASPTAFVFHVAAHWTHLHKGDGERITVATECAGGFNAIVLHWQETFWSVVTALPFRRPKEPLAFQKTRAEKSEPSPALAARPRFETLTLPKPKEL